MLVKEALIRLQSVEYLLIVSLMIVEVAWGQKVGGRGRLLVVVVCGGTPLGGRMKEQIILHF